MHAPFLMHARMDGGAWMSTASMASHQQHTLHVFSQQRCRGAGAVCMQFHNV